MNAASNSRLGSIDLAFAEKVQEWRVRASITENALARLLPPPLNRQVTVNRIINGLRSVTIGEAFIIAAALGLSLAEFQPPVACAKCYGNPPAGFTCNACGGAA